MTDGRPQQDSRTTILQPAHEPIELRLGEGNALHGQKRSYVECAGQTLEDVLHAI